MKKLITILILSFAIFKADAQNKIFGNGFYEIQNYKFGWLGASTADTLVYHDSLRSKQFTPVHFAGWTTAARPSSAVAGYFGYNVDSNRVEWYNGSAWTQPGTSAGGGGTLTGFTSSDNSLTVTGTTAIDAVINLGHSNTWSANQIFNTTTFKLKDADGSNHETWVLGTNHAFDRTVTWTLGDVNKTITMLGTVTIPNNFILTGNFAVGFTFSNTTSVTFPTTGTLATLAGSEAFTNKTLTASSNVLGGVTMTLGSDANGDTYYRSGGVLTRLGIGASGSLITSSGTAPQWTTASSFLTTNNVVSATYVPTLTAVTNVAASAVIDAWYSRNGDIVTVYYTITIDATAALTGTQLDISLPVASNFVAGSDVVGVLYSNDTGDKTTGVAFANDANDRATVSFDAGAAGGNAAYRGWFSYKVL